MSVYDADLAAETLRTGDDGYDGSTRGFFASEPAERVVRPRHPVEVAAAISYAGHHDLTVSVRSGGHSPIEQRGAGIGTLLIDLRHLDGVEILDAERGLVRVGGGATWGQVAAALDPHGLAITAGDTADVGVGGLTLGGGIGWMVRRHGLTIDNLVGARVATADGRLVAASRDHNPDLFWALRGGGGNFGVVVEFDFVAQPVSTVHFGTVTYRLDDPTDLVARWREAMRLAPYELSSTLALTPRFAGATPSATLLLCYVGERDVRTSVADSAIEPLLDLGAVTAATIAERRYSEILEHAEQPPHLRLVTRNTLVRALDAELVAAVTDFHATTGPKVLALRSLGGAISQVPTGATAFAHRDAEAMIVALLMLPDSATESEIEDALVPWTAVAAHGTGTYVNFQGSARATDVAAAYPPGTLARLTAAKRAYDPTNRFAHNHNIEPAR